MELSGQALTLAEIAAVAFGDAPVQIAPSARPRILASRKVVEEIVARDAVVYGVSTGFGKLADVHIPPTDWGSSSSTSCAATPAASAVRSPSRKCGR